MTGNDPVTMPASGAESAPGGFVLRIAGPADVDAIMELETATFENDAWSRAMMLGDLSQKYCYYLVATEAGGAGGTDVGSADMGSADMGSADTGSADIGSAGGGSAGGGSSAGAALSGYAGLMSPQGGSDADIQTIAVAPAARRRGLGRTLMQALITEARARGARRLFLEVRADNPGAQTLYENLGFLPIGVRRGYYQPDDVDAVVMRLDLPAGGSR